METESFRLEGPIAQVGILNCGWSQGQQQQQQQHQGNSTFFHLQDSV